MNNDELKTCPFCGAAAKWKTPDNKPTWVTSRQLRWRRYAVKCSRCPVRMYAGTQEDAAQAWNKRKEGGADE